MSTNLIDGRKLASELENTYKRHIETLKTKKKPGLCVVLVGDNPASLRYISRKKEACERVGIDFYLKHFPENIEKEELAHHINNFQTQEDISGIIIQLPLPEKLQPFTYEIINLVDPDKDVDGMTTVNMGQLFYSKGFLIPATPAAVLYVLKDYLKKDLRGLNITLVGAGNVVGKPLSLLLLQEQATLTICNSATKDIKEKCKNADIIISAVGKRNLIHADMISDNAIVIDVGISFFEGKMCGDIHESILEKAAYVTPTPGGIGPLTVCKLLENTIRAFEKANNLEV